MEDLTDPKTAKSTTVERLANSIYITAIYSGLYAKLRAADILKSLLIASSGASKYMIKVGLITEEELEQIHDEVKEVVDKQNKELESSGILDTLKQAAKECRKKEDE